MATEKKVVTKSKITKATVNELIKLFLAYKKAKNAYENFKKKVVQGLVPGKYIGDEGYLAKVVYDKTTLDIEQLKKDYPKINFDKYRVSSEVEKITVALNKE